MLQHLGFSPFAGDANLFLDNTNILNLETNLTVGLDKVSQWLFANKLSLNIEKKLALWYSILRKDEKLIS